MNLAVYADADTPQLRRREAHSKTGSSAFAARAKFVMAVQRRQNSARGHVAEEYVPWNTVYVVHRAFPGRLTLRPSAITICD